MNKVLIVLLLAIVIFSLWTFDSSFTASSTVASAMETAAVIVAKANYISLRAKFMITPAAGTKATLLLSDGTQKQVIVPYTFEVFLPKNGSSVGNLAANSPGGIFLSEQKPFDAAVVSNATDSFFSELNPDSSSGVTLYWFKIQGKAQVIVACYGVAI